MLLKELQSLHDCEQAMFQVEDKSEQEIRSPTFTVSLMENTGKVKKIDLNEDEDGKKESIKIINS